MTSLPVLIICALAASTLRAVTLPLGRLATEKSWNIMPYLKYDLNPSN